MKVAIAFVLLVLMVAVPATQVLAQTPPQQGVPARGDSPPPPPQPSQAGPLAFTWENSLAPEPLALVTNPLDALLPVTRAGLGVTYGFGADELLRVPMARSSKIALIVLGVLVLAAGIALLVCSLENENREGPCD